MDIKKPQPRTGLFLGFWLAFIWLALQLLGTVILGVGDGGLPPGISLVELLLLYPAGFIVGGLLFGTLLPLAQSRTGCVILGMVVLSPLLLGQAYLGGPAPGEGPFLGAVVTIIVLGGGAGFVGWIRYVKGGHDQGSD